MTAHSSNRDGANLPAPTHNELELADADWGHILCQYGIFSGRYPIAGMRVADVREALTPFFNLDPTAVAVINQRVLSEDDIIGDGVERLVFLKKSALMG